MGQTENELSKAIVLYVGYGYSAYPIEDNTRLTKEFGLERSIQLEKRIKLLLEELDRLKPDWKVHSLASACKWAGKKMKQQHSELDEEAVSAIEWAYSWWWK